MEAVKSFMADSLQKDRRIAELNTRYYALKAEKLREMEGVLVDFEEGMNAVELRKCCDYFMKHTKASVVGVFCPKENGTTGENETRTCSYVIGSTALDVRERAKAFNARVQGRGGGQKEMIQGSLSGTAAEIQQAMQEIFSN